MRPIYFIRQKIQTFLNPPARPVKTQYQPGTVPIPSTQISKQFCGYPVMLVLVFVLATSPLFSQIVSGPAGVGNTDGSEGQPRLVMWLDATQMTQSTGHFATMPDYSGNLNHATTHNNNRPTFQNNTPERVVFNHDNNNQSRFLTFNGNIIANTDYTFTFVGGRLSNNNLRVFVGGSAAANNQNLHLFFNTQNNTNNFHHHHWGNDYNGSLNADSNTGGTDVNSPGIFMALLDQNVGRRSYQNNNVIGQRSNTTPLGSWNDAAFARFTNHNGVTSHHDIFMSEAIVYSAALNPAQITILNNYLHHKYNIAINGLLFNAPVGFKQDIIGIGSFAGSKHTANFGRGGGLFIREANNSLSDGQYIFAGHNNGTGSTTNQLPSEDYILARSNRIWYLERVNENQTEVILGFKMDETGLNAPSGNEIFYLLYREDETGNFTLNTNHISAISEGMVWFSLSNEDLKNGYYTIGRSSETGRTWYTNVSGNWNNPGVWSTVPSPGYENPFAETPTTSSTSHFDRVIITQGHNIIVTTNNKQNLSLNVENGVLDFGQTTGHIFQNISGKPTGVIRLSADNFPQGNAQNFSSANGGSVVYYGNGYALIEPRIFNNVKIKLADPTSSITLVANYFLNGNLTINQGRLRINNDTETIPLTVQVKSDLTVSSTGQIIVGEGNTLTHLNLSATALPPGGRYQELFHQIRLGGNLINEGIIRLTNQASPHYGEFTTTGAATLVFETSNMAHAHLAGITDLYNIIIEKGQTFEIEIHSTHIDNFRIFGRNNLGRYTGGSFTAANPEIRKAIWIKTGTLKLTGNILIPSLTEGAISGSGNGDFAIPALGEFWIAGENVQVFCTANTSATDVFPGTQGISNATASRAFSVLGSYKITDGFLSTRNSAGLIFWPDHSASVEISGGITDVSQFRSANNSIGKTSFIMTGGDLVVRGNKNNFNHQIIHRSGNNFNIDRTITLNTFGGEISENFPLFGILDGEGTFVMSGGVISLYNNSGSGNNPYNNNGLYINASEENQNVTGGIIQFIGLNETIDYDLHTNGPIHALFIKQTSTVNSNRTRVYMGSDITVLDWFEIQDRTDLFARRNHNNFSGPSYNLNLHSRFHIHGHGNYHADGNTTTIYRHAWPVTFSNNITFYNLVFSNRPGQIGDARGLNTNANIEVLNDLSVDDSFTFSYQNGNITVRGDIHNSGTIRHANLTNHTGRTIIGKRGRITGLQITDPGLHSQMPDITVTSPGTGGETAVLVPVFNGIPTPETPLPIEEILIVNPGSGYTTPPIVSFSTGGATAQTTISRTQSIGGNGNGNFSSLEINDLFFSSEQEESIFLSANQTISKTLTLTNGILDIKDHSLMVTGALSNTNPLNYGSSKMIRTNGSHGDGGLSLRVSGNGTYFFPVGTYHEGSGQNRFAYAQMVVSSYANPAGMIQINPVASKLPMLADGSNPDLVGYLNYYWRVRHNFSNRPNVVSTFRTYEDDYYYASGSINLGDMVPGKVINNQRFPQGSDVIGSITGTGTPLLSFNSNILEQGEFTAAHRQMFEGAIRVFYNRTGLAAQGLWNDASTWSSVSHTNTTNTYGTPRSGDIVRLSNNNINDNHYVIIDRDEEAAQVTFSYSGSGNKPRLILRQGFEPQVSIVDGIGGEIEFEMGASGNTRIIGDLSGFISHPLDNEIIYHPVANNSDPVLTSDNITVYPSLRIMGSGGSTPTDQRIISIPHDFTVNGNLRIDNNAILRMHNGEYGNIRVMGDVRVGPDGRAGKLEFPSSGSVKSLFVQGNITVGGSETSQGEDAEIRVLNTNPSSTLHTLETRGNIGLTRYGKINLHSNNTGGNNVNLLVTGNPNRKFYKFPGEDTGNPSATLHSIEINKGNNHHNRFSIDTMLTIAGASDGLEKPVRLISGGLVLNHPDLDITLSSGGADFVISGNTGLIINRGTARITAPGSSGLYLDSYLEIGAQETEENIIRGQLILNGGPGSNNYLEYSSSGRARIEITGGYLEVGSQLRGSLENDNGILTLRMLNANGGGSEVIVGVNGAPNNTRGVFEVHNPRSNLSMWNGHLRIMRGHDNPGNSRAAVYLYPASAGINESSNFAFGDGTNASVITVNSNIDMTSVRINGHATVKAITRDFRTLGHFRIMNNGAFDGNGFDLYVGRNIENSGNPDLKTNTLYLNSQTNRQTIRGHVKTENFVTTNPIGVDFFIHAASSLEIDNDIYILAGNFEDKGRVISVKGNLHLYGNHISTSNGRFVFEGNKVQYIYGDGNIGNFEINNSNQVRLTRDMIVNNTLTLTSGILNIGSHRLTVTPGGQLAGSTFNQQTMIASSGSIADRGLRLFVPTGSSTRLFPIGVITENTIKYTPAAFTITANSSQGSITMKNVAEKHMTTIGPEVLQHYWIAESTGLSGFLAEMGLHYLQSDVVGAEVDYIPAHLYNDAWAKFFESDIDNDQNIIRFTFPSVNTINGDYTAGIDPHIPAQIPVFVTTGSGDWSDPTKWQMEDDTDGIVPVTGPNGHIVKILPGHEISLDRTRILAYRTELEGIINVGTRPGHNLGRISGNGTIKLTEDRLPAGIYTDFMSPASNSTIEYTSGNINIIDLTVYGLDNTYNNFTISGTGIKTIPSFLDINVRINLEITGSSTLQSHANQRISIGGNLIKEPTAYFNINYLANRVILNGTSRQVISGNFSTPSTNRFSNLEINNASGIEIENNVEVDNSLTLSEGILFTDINRMIINNASDLALVANASAYIDGRLQRNLIANTTNNAFFPMGKSGKKRQLSLHNFTGNGFYTVEYIDNDPTSGSMPSNEMNDPLEIVSNIEYWSVEAPANASARVQLHWGQGSGLPEVEPAVLEANVLVAEWDGSSKWVSKGRQPAAAFGDGTGYVRAAQATSFLNKSNARYFTIGSQSEEDMPILPIELIHLDATAKNGHILISWATASETNNHFFTIEKSRDGRIFELVSHENSKASYGNSTELLHYEIKDLDPWEGVTYYRLKQTDFDGSFDYSRPVGVMYGKTSEVSFNLYPNPNNGNGFTITISGLAKWQQGDLIVNDIYGKTISSAKIEADGSGNLIEAHGNELKLNPGIYFVSLFFPGEKYTLRMVVR